VQLSTVKAFAHGVIAAFVAAAACCRLLLLYGIAELQQLVAEVLLQHTCRDSMEAVEVLSGD
jgi:hypothetical protein